jgi:hypothetical protein
MPRSDLFACLATSVVLAGCNAIAGVLAPKITSVQVAVPAGMLVGDSAIATSNANGDDGKTHNGRPVKWRSSDPAALPIDAQGKMVAKVAGRTVTISAEVDGTTGSATVKIGADDNRMGYTLADQPTAPSPYTPGASTSFNSSGGTITVTRDSTGAYKVRFAGLGRPPGGRDNVQVSAYGGTSPVYCKPQMWDATGADMVVPVGCFANNAVPMDSKFTILVIGARAFGATTPLGFSVALGDANAILDTSVTARNSTGGQIQFGYVSEGNYAENFVGLGQASGGAAGPVGLLISPVGQGPRRCLVFAYDLAVGGLGIACERFGGGVGDSAFSLLWFTRGRPGSRYGYALSLYPGATPAPTTPQFSSSSSGGSITSRRTATGTYQVVFAGLARPPGATEIVLVSAFGQHGFCNMSSWANSGTNDLSVNVTCFDPMGQPNNANGAFHILLIQ